MRGKCYIFMSIKQWVTINNSDVFGINAKCTYMKAQMSSPSTNDLCVRIIYELNVNINLIVLKPVTDADGKVIIPLKYSFCPPF